MPVRGIQTLIVYISAGKLALIHRSHSQKGDVYLTPFVPATHKTNMKMLRDNPAETRQEVGTSIVISERASIISS